MDARAALVTLEAHGVARLYGRRRSLRERNDPIRSLRIGKVLGTRAVAGFAAELLERAPRPREGACVDRPVPVLCLDRVTGSAGRLANGRGLLRSGGFRPGD